MTTLERELLKKFRLLTGAAQQQLIESISTLPQEATAVDEWTAWLEKAGELRDTLREKYQGQTGIDVTTLLREVREEDR